LFNNALARRCLSAEVRRQFTEEEEDTVQLARETLPQGIALEKVAAWNFRGELWRVATENEPDPGVSRPGADANWAPL